MEAYSLNKYSVPFEDLLNNFFARKPKDVSGVSNKSAEYYRNWLMRKVLSIYKIDNFPEHWSKDYFNCTLLLDGYLCVTDTGAGVLPLKCGLTGINVFEEPTECIIANPVLGSFRREIGTDCEIVKLQYNYSGIQDMLDRYSYLLSACDSSISVNLMNTKVPFIFECESKAQSETMKKMYDDIAMGKPAVFVRNLGSTGSSFYTLKPKESYIASDIQELKRRIINEFLTEIGINNANTDKRERLITSEVDSNNMECESNIQNWLDNISDSFNRVNKMYDLNLSISRRNIGGVDNEPSKPV